MASVGGSSDPACVPLPSEYGAKDCSNAGETPSEASDDAGRLGGWRLEVLVVASLG